MDDKEIMKWLIQNNYTLSDLIIELNWFRINFCHGEDNIRKIYEEWCESERCFWKKAQG